MVDFYDNVQSFYDSSDYFDEFAAPSSSSVDFFDISTGSFFDQIGGDGTPMPADDPSLEYAGLSETGYDPQLEARGGSGFYEIQEDDRTIFKQLQEYLGLDEILSEKDMKFLRAFAGAAGLLDKDGRITGAGFGRTAYKPKTKTPSMKQGAAISGAKRTANNMAGLSRRATNGNEYLRKQNFNDFVNRVSMGDFGTTGSGLRGTTIKEAGLKDIKARQYVSK